MNQKSAIVESYRLTSMQQGMLFHSLEMKKPGVDIQQITCMLEEDVSVPSLLHAWNEVIKRHAVLRTSFRWKDLSEPHQFVHQKVAIPFEDLDWRSLGQWEQEKRWGTFIAADRRRGFDFTQAPLLRLTLVRFSERSYRLLWTFHHILLDGRSFPPVLREVFSFYEAARDGRVVAFQQPRPFREFVQWFHEQDFSYAEEYWRRFLKGFRTPNQILLPEHRSSKVEESQGQGVCEVTLSAETTTKIKSFVKEHRLSVNTLVQGAWSILLHRYSGDEDVVFGATRACRYSAFVDADSIVGIFINTLPIRVQVNRKAKLLDWLWALRKEQRELRNYEHTPLVDVQRWSEVPRSRPLFDSILVFDNRSLDAALKEFGGEMVSRQFKLDGQTNYPLTVIVYADAEMLLRFEYDHARFSEDSVRRIAVHLGVALDTMAGKRDQRLGDITLLTEGERHQALVDWNDTKRDFIGDKCIHTLIEGQVERTPDAVAVVFEGKQLTYRQLNQRANQLAHYLRSSRVGLDVLVGICVERSLEMIIGLLGILKAGAAYVPLDPAFPAERLAFMMEDAGLKVLITQKAFAGQLRKHNVQTICLDSNWSAIAQESNENPACDITQHSRAYVIYTSGSTGKPKGVEISHRAMVNFLRSMREQPGVTERDVLLAVTTISFDIAGLELYLPLVVGGRVVIASREVAADGVRLSQHISGSQATMMQATPATWRMLLGARWQGNKKLKILCGGESLSRDLADKLLEVGHSLWNVYGPTETTIWSTLQKVEPGKGSILIGRPIANTQVYILDRHLQPVPIGVPGELHIGGAGLAHGYLNRPELTAEKFIPDPFSEDPNDRLYCTGDLARHLPDGQIQCLGRIDSQVKIRGFRIELGEIESVLSQYPGVQGSVAAVREDVAGDKRLVAYIVSSQSSPPTSGGFRGYLQQKLPDYMLPSAFVFLDSLPLTPNGKVDRRSLPAPDQTAIRQETRFTAPRTPVEEVLARSWAEVLKLDRVGVHDNFFDLGGHSLLATQVIFHVLQEFGIELPLGVFFQAPSVAQLASVVVSLQENGGAQKEFNGSIHDNEPRTDFVTPYPIIVPAPQEKHLPFPLTALQQAYWVGRSGTFELGTVSTHVYVEYDCPGLDLERFSRVWQQLVRRHEMLRAIVLPDGQQQILEQVPAYEIEVKDLRGEDCEKRTSRLESIRQLMSHQVLPADRWPLFDIRATLLDDRLVRLHISRDVLMIDASSWSILEREICLLYQEPDTVLPTLDLSFRDYVLAEISLRDSPHYKRSKDYWNNRLSTLPPSPELPITKDPGLITETRFKRRSRKLERDVWKLLKGRAAQAGLTSSGLLLAVFADVLCVWSKSPRFTINLTLFNRLPFHPQVNDIVGDLTSLTLLEVENFPEVSFEERAQHLQRQLWKDMDHRDVSGIEVMRELARRQGVIRGGTMPVVFTSILDQQLFALSAPLDKPVYGITQTPQVWLDAQVFEEKEHLVICWDAVDELFPDGMLRDMFESYCFFLRRLAEGDQAWKDTWLKTVRNLIPTRQLRQRTEVNDTKAAITDDLLQTLFAKQVPQRRQQAAVISPERTLTYEELFCRANQIAHWLRGNGARRNTLVAVVMEKGWEQIAGVLGVLASGAAYLPIDAELPKDRIWYLLQHGEVELVLTQPRFEKKIAWPETVKRLSIDDGSLAGLDEQPFDPSQSPEDIAYVIYTSGSTGLPKGVMIDHRGAVNTILDLNRRFSIKAEDRVLAISSLSFDLSVYDVFGILAAGGTIVVPNAAGLRDPAHWADLVARYRVTLWNSVPALMQMLVEYLEGRGQLLAQDLRLVFMSGDWIPVTLPERIRALSRDIKIISMGGATEASIWSIIYPIETVDPTWKSIPYGRPMVNQTLQVLNDALEPCPIWVPGQLYIGGVGLAKGYWRDEEKTRASFITHPRTGERLYRTGDQGRYLPDGNIEFLGRDDFQVKVQGYRIELGEIETILTQHPRVQMAVVTALGSSTTSKRLIGYVVPESQSALAGQQHRKEPKRSVGENNGWPERDAILRDPLERLKFKLQKVGNRSNNGRATIRLINAEMSDEFLEPYVSRRSYRKFTNDIVSFERFSHFLNSLSPVKIDGTPFPKYRYASAGGLYPVQTFLYIQPNRVEGLAGGPYFYDAANHSLLPLSPNELIPSTEFQGIPAKFDHAAFALFFIAQLSSIAPMYGGSARDFCVIETGAICQLLETFAPSEQIGLCQVGGLDFQPFRHLFDLEESQIYLHCLIGGPISADQTKRQVFVEEMSEYGNFLRMLEEQPGERQKFVHVEEGTTGITADESPSHDDSGIAEELRKYLQTKLPDYMIPAKFFVLDRIPLSANGKVDRKALPEPKSTEFEPTVANTAPSNELERALADIWREILQVEKVSLEENFFDLGGNSLHVVQMHAKIRDRVKREVPIVDLFKYTTIESLADYLSESQNDAVVARQGFERAQLRKASKARRRQSSQQTGEFDD